MAVSAPVGKGGKQNEGGRAGAKPPGTTPARGVITLDLYGLGLFLLGIFPHRRKPRVRDEASGWWLWLGYLIQFLPLFVKTSKGLI